MIRPITETEVIAINRLMIERYSPGEPIGIKDRGLISSSVQRMHQTAFGEDAYPTLFDKAASLFHSLTNNHCFVNANKRTAYAALQLFLQRNGYHFVMETEQAIDFCVWVATTDMDIKRLASELSDHSTEL